MKLTQTSHQVVSENCNIRYVIKILSKNRYNKLNYAYTILGATETRIILRIELFTCMLQFLKLMLCNEINISVRF